MSNVPSALDRLLIKNVQVNGVDQPTRGKVNILGPCTAADNPGNDSTDITVTATSSSGRKNLTLTNGANENISTDASALQVVSGPTGAFSIGSFHPTATLVSGQQIRVVLPAGVAATLIHQSTSAPVGATMLTLPGATKAGARVPVFGSFFLHYDGTNLVATLGDQYRERVDVRDYGAIADLVQYSTPCTTSGTTINFTSGTFTQADLGKLFCLFDHLGSFATAYVTIASVASPMSITVSASLGSRSYTNALVMYGTDNTPAINAAASVALAQGGGDVFIPAAPAAYLVQAGSTSCISPPSTCNLAIVVPGSGVRIVGGGKGGYGSVGATLTMYSANGCHIGTNVVAPSQLRHGGVESLTLNWLTPSGETGPNRQCIGVDVTGFNQVKLRHLEIDLPFGPAIGIYGTTTNPVSGAFAGDYYNEIEDVFVQGFGQSGSKALYFARSTAVTDGGGVNAWTITHMTAAQCDEGFVFELCFGVRASVVVEACVTRAVHFGPFETNGVFADVIYSEGTPFIYKVDGANVTNCGGHHWGGNPAIGSPDGLTVGNLLDPSSYPYSDCRFTASGGHHGLSRVVPVPYPMSIGVLDGTVAAKGIGMADLASAPTQADFNRLLARLRANGTIDPYTPEVEGLVNWWRADYGLVRSPGVALAAWKDLIAGTVATATLGSSSNTPLYYSSDNTAGGRTMPGYTAGQTTIGGPWRFAPWVYTNLGGYFSATLATPLSAGTIIIVAGDYDNSLVSGSPSGTRTLFELTHDGVSGHGVAGYAYQGAGNYVVCRRISSIANGEGQSAGFTVYMFSFSTTQSSVRVNNQTPIVDSTTQDYISAFGTLGQLVIGAMAGGGGNFWKGGVAEFIVSSNPTLSTTSIANIFAYLNYRYGWSTVSPYT